MGIGRVSIPVASIMVMHKALMEFFTALKIHRPVFWLVRLTG